MTTFEALVSMSHTALVHRGEWHGGATSFDDMDAVANGCADLINRGCGEHLRIDRGLVEMAISELKRKASYAAAIEDRSAGSASRPQHVHNWCQVNDLIDRCSVCGEERA